MAERQHPPVFRTQSERLLQALEYEIAIFGPVAMPAQRRESQRVRSVVCKIKPTFEGERPRMGVSEANTARLNESVELGLAAAFLL